MAKILDSELVASGVVKGRTGKRISRGLARHHLHDTGRRSLSSGSLRSVRDAWWEDYLTGSRVQSYYSMQGKVMTVVSGGSGEVSLTVSLASIVVDGLGYMVDASYSVDARGYVDQIIYDVRHKDSGDGYFMAYIMRSVDAGKGVEILEAFDALSIELLAVKTGDIAAFVEDWLGKRFGARTFRYIRFDEED